MWTRHFQAVRFSKIDDGLIILHRRSKPLGELLGSQPVVKISAGRVIT